MKEYRFSPSNIHLQEGEDQRQVIRLFVWVGLCRVQARLALTVNR